MRTLTLSFALLALIGSTLLVAQENSAPSEPKAILVLNEDNSHFFGSRSADEMDIEHLNAFVDQYAGTAVTHLFLNVNASRMNVLNPARQAIWEPNKDGVVSTETWPTNAKILSDKGIDPYEVWMARCREKGISPWCSMRMNDLHSMDDLSNFMHDRFNVTHPEFWRVPNDQTTNWHSRAMNFIYPEVRKHTTDLIDFLFERYDFDGFELDWMRFGYHLTPGSEREEAKYLTEIMIYAREKARQWSVRRGHPILIATRVPAVPEASIGLGMDAIGWAKEGLIDLLIPAPFWSTMDFDIPVEEWKSLLEGTDVQLLVSAEYNVRPYPNSSAFPCSREELYGFAASELYRGADGIYLFNWMDCETLPVSKEIYRQILRDGLAPDDLKTLPRALPLTYHDTVPSDVSNGAQLPQKTDTPSLFTLPLGEKPRSEGSGILVVLAPSDSNETPQFEVALNGNAPVSTEERVDQRIERAGKAFFFVFPCEAFRNGDNQFQITQSTGEPCEIIFIEAILNGAE